MRNDDVEFFNKFEFNPKMYKTSELQDRLLETVQLKFEDWFGAEVRYAYDYGHGIHAVRNLYRYLKNSEVAKAMGMFVFNESFGYLCGVWEDVRGDLFTEITWEEYCRTEFRRLETSILFQILPCMSVSSLNDLLKALNKWELETKVNLKLNSLKEDFQ